MSDSETDSELSLIPATARDGEQDESEIWEGWEEARLPLKANTTGFFLFTVFQYFDKPSRKQVGFGRAVSMLVASTLLHIVNFSVQFGLTFCLLMFSVQRQEDKFQRNDVLSNTPALLAAAANNQTLANTAMPSTMQKQVLSLCHAEHHVPFTQTVILCLWCVKLLPPIVQSFRFTLIAAQMPSEGAHHDQHMVKKEGNKFLVVCMPVWLKVFIFLAANLPRVLLQGYLFYMGGEYLMYATSLNVLITKAVGLAFIKTMSELLFQGLASQKHQDQMKDIFLFYHKKPNKQWWDDWGALLIKFSFCLLISLWFCRIHHGDVQGFRDACFKYHYAFDVPYYHRSGTTFLGWRLSN